MAKMGNYDGIFVARMIPGDIEGAVWCVREIFDIAIRTNKHAIGDWRLLGWEGNFEAFSEHIAKLVKNTKFGRFGQDPDASGFAPDSGEEDHLAHAACRLLLLLQLREEALAARRARGTPKA